jgi:UDP-glucuronate decarboxylase
MFNYLSVFAKYLDCVSTILINWKYNMNALEVVESDLNYIVNGLSEEMIKLSGKRVLITGGAGFLGYYLVQSLVRWNDGIDRTKDRLIDILVYDNFIRGKPSWLSSLESRGAVKLQAHDITDPLPDDIGDVSYIIHAASIASPTYYRKNPIETMDANVNGLRYLLDFFKDRKTEDKFVGGLLYFSTSEIYGDPATNAIPTSETYRGNVSCTGPRASYDESKRYGETLCVNFAHQYGLPIRIARPFNNYGPGLKITDGRALPDFCGNVLSNKDIVLLSDGSPTRTFCYVADAVIGYFKVLTKGRNGESYNIGTESPEISVRQLAEMIIKSSRTVYGYEGQLAFKKSEDKEYLTDNPNRRCPIIKKAQTELDYNPKISIEEGLLRSLAWYSDNMEGEAQ